MKYNTKEDVLKRGIEIKGEPLASLLLPKDFKRGKGGIGQTVEAWFGIKTNNISEPDFKEAKVELKVTPYIMRNQSIRAKERLVCNIINYMEEYKKTFQTSSFYHKCKTMLIMPYKHTDNLAIQDVIIDEVVLFEFSPEDRLIIEQDWETIVKFIKQGKAHELSERLTNYLGACTKGATSESSYRRQPFSDEPAKQRAFSLKQSYMTQVLNDILKKEKLDSIIRDPNELKCKSFESYIKEKVQPYYGKTQSELINMFKIQSSPKNINEIVLGKILDVDTKISKTSEFTKANIVPKTIRLNQDGSISEHMSFPKINFPELVNVTWEDSSTKEYFETTKFLFVIFRFRGDGELVFEKIQFWTITEEGLSQVEKVWQRTQKIVKEGVVFERKGNRTGNNLPKSSENQVCHVRPHGRNANDTDLLPDGRSITKQCFWLDKNYIREQITIHLEEHTEE